VAHVLVKRPGRPAEWIAADVSEPPCGAFEPPVAGSVFGVALNDRRQVERLADAFRAPPYRAPPRAPVLYIKPPNTWCGHGGAVPVPGHCERLAVAATVGIVIGRSACRVAPADALDHVLGYTLAIDVSEPQDDFFRPAIRQQCRDGFLPIGPWVVDRADAPPPDGLSVELEIGGRSHGWSLAELIRPIPELIAEISDFMTLAEGDVLLPGLPAGRVAARVGDTLTARAAGLGRLDCTLVAEAATARRAA
jgi:5-oxopent-3-ene-1,2,5-tricarboxylate decarboxylase/2-hydroxyhepta-2,4-diene-1,7-dioate isomerase